jgi:histidine triad (HIT) family protein
MTADPDCIFCKIVSGELPSFKIVEDDYTLTFLDLFPVSDGHTLVIPKRHFRDVFEIDETSLAAVTAASRRVAHAIEIALQPDGLSVFQLNRAAAGQTVFHYHMHLLPRNAGDPFKLHSRVRASDDALREIAARIATAMEREN